MDKDLRQFFGTAKQIQLSASEKRHVLDTLAAGKYPRAGDTFLATSLGIPTRSRFELDAIERSDVRERIVSYVKMRPIRERHSFFAYWSLHRMVAMTACIALLVGAGGTVSYAAESAMPDDALYNVKLNVNEPLVDLLQWTPERKARWAARRLERRMEEVAHMSHKNALTPQHREWFEKRFERRMAHLEERLTSVPAAQQNAVLERMAQATARHDAILESLESGALEDRSEVRRMRKKMQHMRSRMQKQNRDHSSHLQRKRHNGAKTTQELRPVRRKEQRMQQQHP